MINLIEVYNQNLNLKRTIPIKGNDVRGLAYNDESLWITINDTERDPVHYILQISTDGEELRELSFPNEWGSGMAHDGENLYLINNDNNGIYKLDTDIEYPKPTAAFDINTNEPGETAVVGEEVTFDASDSSHPMNAITTYEWDFTGDGTIDVEESSPRVQYSYDESGEYPVTLHLSDEYDNEVTKTNEVQITEQRDDSDQTSSSSQGTSDEGALDDSVPGFGITGTITGLGSISYMLKQQLPDDD